MPTTADRASVIAQVKIKFTAGAHVTNTVNGQRASSTMSAEQAVQVLATKLFPSVQSTSHFMARDQSQTETWEIRVGTTQGAA